MWRVKFNPGSGVSVHQLDKTGVEDVEAREDRVGFLPKWYLEELGVSSYGIPPLQSAVDSDAEPPPAHVESSPNRAENEAASPLSAEGKR